ncbi:MAG: hypothetical protein EOP10_27025, partial [Proteobacteria bacterium]
MIHSSNLVTAWSYPLAPFLRLLPANGFTKQIEEKALAYLSCLRSGRERDELEEALRNHKVSEKTLVGCRSKGTDYREELATCLIASLSDEGRKARLNEYRIRSATALGMPKTKYVSLVAIAYLLLHGELLWDGAQSWYFDVNSRRLLGIEQRGFKELIWKLFEINSRSEEFNYLIAEADCEARIYGARIKPHRQSFYDSKENWLFVFNRPTEVYLISKVGHTIISNGDLGIYFVDDPSYEPFTYVSSYQPYAIYDIFKMFNFDTTHLSCWEQCLAFIFCHCFSMFSRDRNPIKAFIGMFGTGKSTL